MHLCYSFYIKVRYIIISMLCALFKKPSILYYYAYNFQKALFLLRINPQNQPASLHSAFLVRLTNSLLMSYY